MRVQRGDLSVLWMTFGGIIVAASICAGIPLGLTVGSKGSILLVSLIFFAVFILGFYICIASFGTLPLPELGKGPRVRAERKAEEERLRKLRKAQDEEIKDKERRKAGMESIKNAVKQAENKPESKGTEND